MGRQKNSRDGRRHNVYILERHAKLWKELENKSNFIQICLDNATDIMAWAILKDVDPKKYKVHHDKSSEQIQKEFNEKYPPDKLTAKRLKKPWKEPSPKLPDILS